MFRSRRDPRVYACWLNAKIAHLLPFFNLEGIKSSIQEQFFYARTILKPGLNLNDCEVNFGANAE